MSVGCTRGYVSIRRNSTISAKGGSLERIKKKERQELETYGGMEKDIRRILCQFKFIRISVS